MGHDEAGALVSFFCPWGCWRVYENVRGSWLQHTSGVNCLRYTTDSSLPTHTLKGREIFRNTQVVLYVQEKNNILFLSTFFELQYMNKTWMYRTYMFWQLVLSYEHKQSEQKCLNGALWSNRNMLIRRTDRPDLVNTTTITGTLILHMCLSVFVCVHIYECVLRCGGRLTVKAYISIHIWKSSCQRHIKYNQFGSST